MTTQAPIAVNSSVTPAGRPLGRPARRRARGAAQVLTHLARLLFILFLVVTGAYFMLQLVPGDPAVTALGPSANPSDYAAVRHELGLDQPALQGYLDYLGRLVQGNLGRSLFPPRQPVVNIVLDRAPVTIEIAVLALLLAVLIAVPTALWAAARRNSLTDRILTGLSFGWISIPSFLSGLLVVYLCVFESTLAKSLLALVFVLAAVSVLRGPAATWLRERGAATPNRDQTDRRALAGRALAAVALVGIAVLVFARFPHFATQGFTPLGNSVSKNVKSVVLPVVALALTEAAVFTRVLRSDLLHTLGEDFILAARAKGMPAWRIMARDALRPSLFSLVTVVSVSLGRLIGGSVIIESLFNMPGLGNLVFEAVTRKNFPVVQGCVLVIATFYILVNLAVDIAYRYLDPRIRRGR